MQFYLEFYFTLQTLPPFKYITKIIKPPTMYIFILLLHTQ